MLVALEPDRLPMSLDALTPAMRSVLERIQRARRGPLHTLSLQEVRGAYEIGAEMLDLPRAALSREFCYTLGFFMFWLATASASLFTWILLRPASRFNKPLPPG